MATFNYARSQATAERLIRKFGQAVLIRRTIETGDPWGGGAATTTEYDGVAAVLDFNNSDIDGTLVKQGDRKVYLSARGLAVTPTTTDKIVIGGKAFTIIATKPLNPAGTVVYWELQVSA